MRNAYSVIFTRGYQGFSTRDSNVHSNLGSHFLYGQVVTNVEKRPYAA